MKKCTPWLVFSLAILLFSTNSIAQNENNFWFFGVNAGLDFSSGSPVAISGNLNTYEGCASISESSGDLLFYTDGTTVYNKTGAVMTNGNGLFGDPSSTSSAIIVPRPCSNTQYIVFTVDFVNGSDGINYSLIEMDDDNDGIYEPLTEDGVVVTGMKNINLPGPTGERICAIKHTNGIDYWVTATQMNTNNYYTYLVTSSGVSLQNQQSLGGNIFAGYYMKFSPDGTKMARTNAVANGQVFLYDFDTTTGLISNEQLLGNAPIRPYGLEFSSDSQRLFYSDLANGNGTGTGFIFEVTIQPTIGIPIQLASFPNQGGGYAIGALQRSPVDPNIIYAAMDGENFLGAINVQNSTFNRTAQPLSNTCRLGLPTFISGQINTACLALDPIQPAIPTIAPQTVADEISQGNFENMDKEYGDFDNDGDVDILYTKTVASNSPGLHVLYNTAGPGSSPVYALPGVDLNLDFCYSYRLYDWDNDGWNDVVVYGHNAGLYVFYNNQAGGLNPTPLTLLQGTVDFTYVNQALIAVGDLNNDTLPDVLISSQNGAFPGTVYFENVGGNSLTLPAPQVWTPGVGISNPFIFENGGSYPTPEIFDADCDGDNDLFLSDPLFGPPFGGGRMYFHENNGGVTANSFPDVNITGVINQYGFLDDVDPNSPLSCDWIITRIVDYRGDECPVAISYNPCNDEFFFYDQDCDCTGILTVNDFEDEVIPNDIRLAPNPTSNFFRIASEKTLSIQKILIYNLQGRQVASFTESDQYAITTLSKGMYLVQIISEGKTITKKLIIN